MTDKEQTEQINDANRASLAQFNILMIKYKEQEKVLQQKYTEQKSVDIPKKDKNSFFKTLGSALTFKSQTNEEQILENQVSKALYKQDFVLVHQLIQNGAKLSKTQKEMLHTRMIDSATNVAITSGLHDFDKLISNNIVIQPQYLVTFLLTEHGFSIFSKLVRHYNNNAKNFNISVDYQTWDKNRGSYTENTVIKYKCGDFMLEQTKNRAFNRYLFEQWNTHLDLCTQSSPSLYLNYNSRDKNKSKSYEVLSLTSRYSETLKLIMLGATEKEYLDCIGQLYKCIAQIRKHEQNHHIDNSGLFINYTKSYNECISTFQKLIDVMQENIFIRYPETFSKYDVSPNVNKVENSLKETTEHVVVPFTKDVALPHEINIVLQQLTDKYNNIKSNLAYLGQTEQFDVEKMFTYRKQEIIGKYIGIDPAYRNNLTNTDGKTATILLLESLGNIDTVFSQVIERINIAKLNSLSASQRYTTSMKNTYQNDSAQTESIDRHLETNMMQMHEQELEIGASPKKEMNELKFKNHGYVSKF